MAQYTNRSRKTGRFSNKFANYSELTQWAFSGIHVIDASVFSKMEQTGKFSMVEVYLDLMHTNAINKFDHSKGKLIDVGKPESIAQAATIFS